MFNRTHLSSINMFMYSLKHSIANTAVTTNDVINSVYVCIVLEMEWMKASDGWWTA